MKRFCEFLLLITVTLAFPKVSFSDNTTITISTGEWPPYLSEKIKYRGVAARIIKESFSLQGIDVKFGWFPWKRSYNNVRNGSWDASAIWAITHKRSQEVLFSDPVIENKTVLFFNKDTFKKWQSIKDLSGLVIGATNGYFNGKEFKKAEEEGLITVERTSIEKNNFKKLAARRLDAVIADIDTGYDIMNRMLTKKQKDAIAVNPKIISSFSNHLVISKKMINADKIVFTFNKGLKQLITSGKVKQYLQESREGLYHQ